MSASLIRCIIIGSFADNVLQNTRQLDNTRIFLSIILPRYVVLTSWWARQHPKLTGKLDHVKAWMQMSYKI